MLVTCEERCWDGKRHILFNLGDKADVDPLSPLAKYFGGWSPETEVYTKSKGVEGTRIVPGNSPKTERLPILETNDSSGEDNIPRGRGRPRAEK